MSNQELVKETSLDAGRAVRTTLCYGAVLQVAIYDAEGGVELFDLFGEAERDEADACHEEFVRKGSN
jgi:hypothetical protein